MIRYANGRTRFVLPNGGTSLVGRDGKVISEYSLRSSVQTLDPAPPKDQKVSHWFERHAADLLDALMSVVVGDRAAVRSSYLKREPSGLTVYQQIDSRTRDLARLVEP